MSETRKLAAILAADVVGYSRLTGGDEELTLARLRTLRSDLIDPTIAVHNGRVVKRMGDGVIVEFAVWSRPCAAPRKCRAAWPSATPACPTTGAFSFASAFT
jgi:adenylate cyclase